MLKQAAISFVEKLAFVYPIFFESGDRDYPYYCGGTCFAVRFHGRLFLVTARHCLDGRAGDPYIIAANCRSIPIRQSFHVIAEGLDSDWSDVVCFSTYGREYWPALGEDNSIDFAPYLERKISADPGDCLAFKGYPASHMVFQDESKKIIRKPSFHLGFYGGRTIDSYCHYMNVLHPLIGDPNGLSGTPIIKMHCDVNGAVEPLLLGMITRGGKNIQVLRFIGVDILIKVVLAVDGKMNAQMCSDIG